MRLLGFIAVVIVAVIGARAYSTGQPSHEPVDVIQYEQQKVERLGASNPRLHLRDLSVEEAYGRIPHARTPFRQDHVRMPAQEARYLDALFRLTDAGVVERVFLQSQILTDAPDSTEAANYDGILAGLAALSTPNNLLNVEALILEAIEEQNRYLEDWRQSDDPRYFSSRAPLVQSSHRKLISAYKILMRLYPGEGRHNKQAFYDHLCALDFI